MEKKAKNLLKACALFILFSLSPLALLAQAPIVTAYLCGNGEATLEADFGAYQLQTGDQVVWNETTGTGGAVTYIQGTSPSVNFVAKNLTDGEHKYRVHVIPADQLACPGDPSEEYVIYKLPTAVISLAAIGANYCTSAPETAVITASTSPTLPIGVTLDYTWKATKLDGTTVVPIADLGSNTNNIFTFKTGVTPGGYMVTAVAKYNTGSVPIKPDVSCEFTSTTTQTVTVTAVPDKPTIKVL